MRLLKFVAVILLVSCADSVKTKKTNCSLDLDSLASKTYFKYIRIPKKLDFLYPYSEYQEIIQDINNLEKCLEYDNEFQVQLFKISKFKAYLMSGNFNDSYLELSQISNKKDFQVLKKNYFGVYYFAKKEHSLAEQFFKEAYLLMLNQGVDELNCFHYNLLRKLNNKEKFYCESPKLNKQIDSLFEMETSKIIIEYFLAEIEL